MGCSMDRCNDGVSLCCHGRKPTPQLYKDCPRHARNGSQLGGSLLSMHAHTATLFASGQEAAQRQHCLTRRSLILILYRLHFEHDVLGAALYTHLGNITKLNWHHSTLRSHS